MNNELDVSQQALALGDKTAAVQQLREFLNELSVLRQAGVLGAATADFLSGEIQTVIDLLQPHGRPRG